MKKSKLFLFLLGCLVSTHLFSQICSPISSGNNNTLDWENTSTLTFYLSSNGGTPSYIVNPFFATGTSCNDNIVPFCNPPSPNNDISSADGWRYVTHDFGQFNNTIECPVFILYNIYSGMLRVFFYKSLTTPSNSAVITLNHRQDFKRTALLEHYGSPVKNAVQVFDNANKSIKIPNTYVLSPSWSHADFITQYDPCTCQSSSAYILKLVSTQSSNISFTVNGQTKQDVKANQVGGGTQAFTVKTATDGLTAISNIFNIGSGSAPNEYANVLNTLVSNFTKLGSILKAVDFFVGLFKEQPSPPKVTPLVFNVNLSGNGFIDTDNPLQNSFLNNPGSDLSNVTVGNRPTYNNVMGTFSLLKTPQINVNTYVEHNYNSFFDYDYNMQCDEEYGHGYSQIELVSPIKWLLNPDAQLSVDKLNAAYVVHFQNGQKIETDNYPLECFLDYTPTFSLGNYYYGCYSWATADLNPITQVDIKIIGNFVAGNNQKLVFSSLYASNRTETGLESQPTDAFPSSNCSAISPSASFSEIQTVCNSYEYTSRRDQFSKPQQSDDNVNTTAKEKNKLKNKIEIQVSPNPASNDMDLQYFINKDSPVNISIYDLTGRNIKSLVNDNEIKEGHYTLHANLSDVPSGMYFVVMDVNGKREIKKLSVLKK